MNKEKMLEELNKAIQLYECEEWKNIDLRIYICLKEIEVSTELYIYLLEQFNKMLKFTDIDLDKENETYTYKDYNIIHNENISGYEGFRFVYSIPSYKLKDFFEKLKEEGKE